jgi:uncharacterized damage-inducible protein DinB
VNGRDILTIYEYNYWATKRILTASVHSFGSLRGTLVHILDAECAWRMLASTGRITAAKPRRS